MLKMRNTRREIGQLIINVCQVLDDEIAENVIAQMLGTAAAESSLIHRKQSRGGPARGLWQVEPATALDLFDHHLAFRLDRFSKLIRIWLELDNMDWFIPTIQEISHHLERYDDFACAMARLKYRTDSAPIPDTLQEQAEYWYRVYQTPGGAHDPNWYIEQWENCECSRIMERTLGRVR